MFTHKNICFIRLRNEYEKDTFCNCSAGRCTYCTDRKKVIHECKNTIAEGDLGWIFAVTVKGLNSSAFCK